MNNSIFYKLLIIFIVMIFSFICGYLLEIRFHNCNMFECSFSSILIFSLLSTTGLLVLFFSNIGNNIGHNIEVFIVSCFFIYILLLIINWIFFFKPKLIHLFLALIWITIGFIFLYSGAL